MWQLSLAEAGSRIPWHASFTGFLTHGVRGHKIDLDAARAELAMRRCEQASLLAAYPRLLEKGEGSRVAGRVPRVSVSLCNREEGARQRRVGDRAGSH